MIFVHPARVTKFVTCGFSLINKCSEEFVRRDVPSVFYSDFFVNMRVHTEREKLKCAKLEEHFYWHVFLMYTALIIKLKGVTFKSVHG